MLQIKCPECKKEMHSKENLLLHIGFVHDLLWCDICKETFRKQHLLRKHNNQFHKSNKTSKKNVVKKEKDQSTDSESIVENILTLVFDIGPRQIIERILPYFTIKKEKQLQFFIHLQKFWI